MAVERLPSSLYTSRQGEPPSPPRFTVLEALRRQLPIAALPVVVLVVAALAAGYVRSPVYTSESRLNVGGLNLTQQSIEGYTAAVTQLAVAYSRAIHADGVVDPVGHQLGQSPQQVIDHLSATPIQNSSVIRVRATADDAKGAERLADASADSLVDYAIELNSGKSASGRLLIRFRAASRELQRRLTTLRRTSPADPRRRALQTQVDTARLEKNTAGVLYTQSQAGQAATELVQKLAPAAEATSDRQDVLKDYLAGALIAGILIGVGLAVARANALARRRLGDR
jgi:capsular polysaccharide biosynthesis protein